EQEQALGFTRGISGTGLVMAFVSLVILPPLAEEIIFRGFLYGTLRANKVRAGVAILVTSLIFGSLHLFGAAEGGLLWIAFVDTFILSLVLCYFREQNGTIWASVGIHALKNGFVFLNLFIINAH
ncbi:MAG: CPBP family intramembrane glutamic endopeptidase, partial [Patescibacteria group bacterium]